MNFPDRSTECGALINSYLTNSQEFNGETIHLLFTLNRWEARKNMEDLLKDGVTLVVDRYAYSGVAFSAAKGLDTEWCKAPEKGLIKPDLVLLLKLSAAAIAQRGGFGTERWALCLQTSQPNSFDAMVPSHFSYEIPELQQKVMKMFDFLKDEGYWTEINADKTPDDLHTELLAHVQRIVADASGKELGSLWWNS